MDVSVLLLSASTRALPWCVAHAAADVYLHAHAHVWMHDCTRHSSLSMDKALLRDVVIIESARQLSASLAQVVLLSMA